MIQLLKGDCLEVMKSIPSGSIDAIITDPPYGTTACKWDSVIPFTLMWEQLNRIIKPNGAIVLFGSEPFSSALRMSNIKMYKYDWIWKKNTGTGFAIAKYQPLRYHENILIFSKNKTTYNPIPTERFSEASKKVCKKPVRGGGKNTHLPNDIKVVKIQYDSETKNPESVLDFTPNTKAY
jgi:DNA modification methylase